MKNSFFDMVILGSANVDHILNVKDFPTSGQTITGANYKIAFGGKGANQAVAAGRSGANVAFIARVGDDEAGNHIKTQLEKDHVNTQAVQSTTNQNTGVALIFVDQHADNFIGIHAGANAALNVEYVKQFSNLIQNAKLLLLQLETPLDSIMTAANIAHDAGVKIILNPAPAQPLSPDLLKIIDFITPNETEAEILTGIKIQNLSDVQKAAQILHGYGIKTVVITLGAQGVWLSEIDQGQLIPAFAVDAIDSIAAGDTFNGAFATALLEGKSNKDAAQFANAAAAITVTRYGAQSSIPYRTEIETLLNEKLKI
ncbi:MULTISPECIES: ribokinase [unclassified Acinetobacter]|uniref:ribokinase n=1 Tax=unclassified Acinetobacter TaxID=196816 RepID=UPI00190CACD6|nr:MULTISPECIES: ribokinase [unclassified Acinetobacter]MBK0063387.1 ribokinase [Acinetobacter sp. S55]MBK0066701.1 ribokinase [Acinetobacter sp. S54]